MWSMWPKFGNSSISMREFITFLRGGFGSNSITWAGTRYALKIVHWCGKDVKSKSQKVFGANSYVCRSYRGKTGRTPPPHFILNGVKISDHKYWFWILQITAFPPNIGYLVKPLINHSATLNPQNLENISNF